MRLIAPLCGILAACAPPAPPQRPPAPSERKVVFLVHGYISDAEEFSVLARSLAHGGEHGAPLHVHRFDYSRFSRVGSDHNLGVERLGEALGEAVSAARQSCPVCRAWADTPVDVSLVGRSFGGYIVREALLQDAAAEWGPWEVDRVVTMASPLYGSTLTRYSTGFLSVLINGGIRTALFGFLQPERGGAFGHVIDAQVRAMRLGSPYQLDVHDRMEAWLGEDYPPPWLVVPSLGARNTARKGDGVVRLASANLGPVFPGLGVETLPIVVRHGNVFAGEPQGSEATELDRALRAVRHFVDHGTVTTLSGLEPVAWRQGALRDVSRAEPPADAVWVPASDAAAELVRSRYERVALADLGDVWLRFFRGTPGVDAQPLPLAPGLSPLQSSTEWSRRWLELDVAPPDATGTSVLAVEPVGPRHVFLADVTPTGTWSVGLDLSGVGPVPAERLRVRVNGGPLSTGGAVDVSAQRNNVVDVFVLGAETGAAAQVEAIRWTPPEPEPSR